MATAGFIGCVTIMCSTPAAFASRMSRRSSVGEEWPVARVSFLAAMTFRTSLTSGSSCPLRATDTNGRASPLALRAPYSASRVGIQTTRPHPPLTLAISSTADTAIERDAAEQFDAGNELAGGIRELGGRIAVVLQHEATHAPVFRQFGE